MTAVSNGWEGLIEDAYDKLSELHVKQYSVINNGFRLFKNISHTPGLK